MTAVIAPRIQGSEDATRTASADVRDGTPHATGSGTMSEGLRVFEDPTRRRWRRTLTAFALVATAAACFAAAVVAQILVDPKLPSAAPPSRPRRHALAPPETLGGPPPAVSAPAAAGLARGVARLARRGRPVNLAFLVQGEPDGLASLRLHAADLDVVVPDWFAVTGPTGAVAEHVEPDALAALKGSGVAVLAGASNASDDGWRVREFEELLDSEPDRTDAVRALADATARRDAAGLNLDVEGLGPESQVAYLEFVQELAAALHSQGRLLVVDVPPNDPAFDREAIGAAADAVVLMAYDEHYPGGAPGPIAGESWFEDAVDQFVDAVGAGKLIVALGNYGYDWTRGSAAPAASLTFAEAMAVADGHGDREPVMDRESRNMRFDYVDAKGRAHDVWFLDMLSAWNESRIAASRGVAGVGLWRLGAEAPDTWRVLSGGLSGPDELRTASPLPTTSRPTPGELFRIKSAPHAAPVELAVDDEFVSGAHYLDNPTGYELERVGAEMPPKTLVLTFDDGPDPAWTPKILEALDRLGAPAAFFVVGEQAARRPDLVREEAKRGFLVGNHTYLHPDVATVSATRLRAELNGTQRLIESLTNRRTSLFRAPFDADSAPSKPGQLDALRVVCDLGYVVAAANIDGNDWARPGADAIARLVEHGAEDPENHVIVLHDAGGDRSQTVAALEKFVPELRAKGYRFVSLTEACGVPRDRLDAPLTRRESVFAAAASASTWMRDAGWKAVAWLFGLSTALSLLRLLTLGSLVLPWFRRRGGPGTPPPTGAAPRFVSVIVPAVNEEKVIARTLQVLLASEHRDFEALVVDDGSTDSTAELVSDVAARDSRVRLVRARAGGKAAALNAGLRAASADVVVTMDADTLLAPQTIGRLVAPFDDPSVDAVCGNVEVGNVRNVLTAFQSVEYVTSQNFDRRAFERLNCITVVPGATGAWRRRRVLDVGGYSADTLTEDADLTLQVLSRGGRVVYAPDARSRTEAPETVAALARQRFRWSFGTFQCMWKHRRSFFRGTLGWVGLPNLFLFQVLLPALSPIGDAVFLAALIAGDVRPVLAGYLLFLGMDAAASAMAFAFERRSPRLMWTILIQRFFYRQFMYVVTLRALVAALRGARHGWNKLSRLGTVSGHPEGAERRPSPALQGFPSR